MSKFKKPDYSDVCFFSNMTVICLLTAVTGVAVYLLSDEIVIAAFIMLCVYGWIVQNWFSKYVNTFVEKVLKVRFK